ncbi:MAG: 16S rRNA (cytosine(967)-C(5))-methyltransferase RsmB [Clostridia bacterium]|nr:16S rRNA (cytosine(967)-C(5))-methyltransferase RsmB [Clostridia bacterium]
MDVLNIAYKLLRDYESSGKYVNLSLSSHIADGLTDEERSRVTLLLYTTVERKLTYDYYIAALTKRPVDKLSDSVRDALRLGLCQLLDIDNIPDYAAVNESVKLVKMPHEKRFVNAVLREAARNKGSLPLPDRKKNCARHLSVYYSYPLWMVKRFISLFGEEEAELLLSSMNEKKPLTLAVNTTKITRDDFIARLGERGVSARATEHSKIGVRLDASLPPKRLFGYDEGCFFVQDEASQIAAAVLDPKPNDVVIDTCAAPGGKSFSAAILSSDGATIYSFDIHESKMSLIKDGAARLGLSSIRASVRDGEHPDESLFGLADKVVCDAPCSGLGVISKKPDLRYKSEESIKELPALQLSILAASAKYLKVGGELVYSTCTVLPEENGEVISAFLEGHAEFIPQDFSVGGKSSCGGALQLLPQMDGTDGFFIAKLRKVK